MKRVTIELTKDLAVVDHAVEIVERKGVGHPDYICDAVMDRVSVALSREYIKRFGAVLHHNIDKGMLVAGSVEKRFGGGRVLKPMELIIGDRAAFRAGDKEIPVRDIAVAEARAWFKENLPEVDPDRDVLPRVVLLPGSDELSGIFRRKGRLMGANDTSAAVGYAPLTPTEKAVYDIERFINSPAFKLRFPEAGEDVKVMGLRRGKDLDVTVACPLSARLIRSEAGYFKVKEAMNEALDGFLSGLPFKSKTLEFNALDRKGLGQSGVYLTLLGTSAEDADSGEVGRGNRVNGVISLNRPMGTEAAAGKNPVSHVGKIYTIMSHQMAAEVYKRLEGVKEVYVWMLSQIGSPIDAPKEVYVRIVQGNGGKGGMLRHGSKRVKGIVNAVIEEFMAGMLVFTEELSRGEHPVC